MVLILVLVLVLACLPVYAEVAPVTVAPVAMPQIDLTPIINAVIALIAAWVAYKFKPWIEARTTEAQQTNIQKLAKTLVYAAEQVLGDVAGEKKLAWVENEMQKRGYKVDVAAIEAAVKAMRDHEYAYGELIEETIEVETEG